jgi:hypothetical protein
MTDFDFARPRTNGDLVAPYVGRARAAAAAGLARVREHPDEAAVAAVPLVLLSLATARHRLNLIEQLVVTECAVYGGILAAHAYRQWKERPAGPLDEGVSDGR